MDQHHALYDVIHEVSKDFKTRQPSQKVVIIDVAKRRAVDPFEAILIKRNYKYYLVSNTADPINEARDSIQFKYKEDPPGERSLTIVINYVLRCPPGAEKKLAEALCAEADPAQSLSKLISRWLHSYIISARGPFIDSFLSVKNQLASTIKARAQSELGIRLEIGFSLPKPDDSDVVMLSEPIAVRFRDYDKEETLKVKAELSPDVKSAVLDDVSLKEKLQNGVRRYFASQVTLHSFSLNISNDSFKQETINYLNRSLKPIGYELKFISFERDNGASSISKKWLDFFEIETDSTEQEFQTNEARFPVRMSIVINTRLRNLDGVKSYLNGGVDIPAEMKKKAIEAAKQYIRDINPERFYVRFDQSQIEGEAPVKSELISRISATLTTLFNAEIRSINLRVEETVITQRLAELRSGRETFEVMVTPLNNEQPYSIIFSGEFRVLDLNYDTGWENFITSLPDINRIRECIGKSIKARFQNYNRTPLVFRNSIELDQITEAIGAAAEYAVSRDFGLKVTVYDITRSLTKAEDILSEGLREGNEELIRKLTGQITDLKARLLDRFIEQASEDELMDIKREISRLETCISSIESTGRIALDAGPDVLQLPE